MSDMQPHDGLVLYKKLLDTAEWFAIFGRVPFVFRFGPFTGPEIGAIIERSVADKLPMMVTAVNRREIPWEELIEAYPPPKEETT